MLFLFCQQKLAGIRTHESRTCQLAKEQSSKVTRVLLLRAKSDKSWEKVPDNSGVHKEEFRYSASPSRSPAHSSHLFGQLFLAFSGSQLTNSEDYLPNFSLLSSCRSKVKVNLFSSSFVFRFFFFSLHMCQFNELISSLFSGDHYLEV